jgi:hypothetical protein
MHTILRPHRPLDTTTVPNGPAAAALLGAGIGAAVLGLVTIGAESLPTLSQALVFSQAVGPLSGKSTVAMAGWLVGWGALHVWWRTRDVRLRHVALGLGVGLSVGLLGTFPPVFGALEKLLH